MEKSLAFYTKVLAPALLAKAMRTFDKATIVIISVSWGGALFFMLFALYTANLSVQTKHDLLQAASAEPSLPKMISRKPEISEIEPIISRLQKRFPEIKFELANNRNLTVSAIEGSKFRTWLTVLSYIDTISPEYRWEIEKFCVGGTCRASAPMTAVLEARKISFMPPKSLN